jgi:hypothetical protein
VKIIVATHWHDDHIRGLAQTVRRCASAIFYCSSALGEQESLAFFGTQAPHTFNAGGREFHDVLEVLAERAPPQGISPIHWAISGNRIFYRAAASADPECTVFALSPSHASVTRAKQALRALMPRGGQAPRFTPWQEPNHNAVVLWISVGPGVMLLGADLEETGHPQAGWSAVLLSSDHTPAQAFKVPHHGSRTGHHDGVWNTLLIPQPLAVLTPFARGRVDLPTADDRARISAYTPHAYITLARARSTPPSRDPAVDRTMREVTRNRYQIDRRAGHIMARRPLSAGAHAAWHVSLHDGAVPLSAS